MTDPKPSPPSRKLGLWLIGAFGGVGTTAALGLADCVRNGRAGTGMVTGLPLFDHVPLDPLASWVVGGHDIRATSFQQTAAELQQRSSIFTNDQIHHAESTLAAWSANVRPGCAVSANAAITATADHAWMQRSNTPHEAIQQIQKDLREFQQKYQLDDVIVVNVASTEPPFPPLPAHESLQQLTAALQEACLPASSLYAYASLDLGFPYVNFTPSLGASIPALVELAHARGTTIAGKDGKTGETLIKTALAPMFAHRNLRVLSWVGHNILGGGDGRVLADPTNKASKVKTKDAVLDALMGYRPQTHVSIEYIESLDDWKTAWDHIHFEGFLGVKMVMQFTWQGCDSILAAPLLLDIARLSAFAHHRGESGVLTQLACFFKSPMGVSEHDFHKQFEMLVSYVQTILRDSK